MNLCIPWRRCVTLKLIRWNSFPFRHDVKNRVTEAGTSIASARLCGQSVSSMPAHARELTAKQRGQRGKGIGRTAHAIAHSNDRAPNITTVAHPDRVEQVEALGVDPPREKR